MKKKLTEIGINNRDIKKLPLNYLKLKELSGGKTYNLSQFESFFFSTKSINRKDFYKPISRVI
jgi:hypothetical protein